MAQVRTFIGSRRAGVIARGFVDGSFEVDRGSGEIVRLEGTCFEDGCDRAALSAHGSLLAAAHYYAGVEIWSVSERRCLWTAKGRSWDVQAVSFIADGSDVLVDSDRGGMQRFSIGTGRDGVIRGLHFASVSPDGSRCFGAIRGRRQALALADLDSCRIIERFAARSFGVICACFAGPTMIVSETEGWLRAITPGTGEWTVQARGERWPLVIALAQVEEREEVVGWGSLPGDPKSAPGELFRLDLRKGRVESVLQRPYGFACAIENGRRWVFADGFYVDVG